MQNQIKSNSRSTKKNSAENISDYLAFVLQHDSYTWNDKLDIIDEIVNKKGDYADDSYLDEELDNRRFKEWRKVYKSKESPQAQKVRAMGFTGE